MSKVSLVVSADKLLGEIWLQQICQVNFLISSPDPSSMVDMR